jgi:putative uncharacterized protein (fragment)
MKVSYERLFHRGFFGRFAALLYFVLAVAVPLRAVADTGLPPPQTPNQAISQASSSDNLRYSRIGPNASWDVGNNTVNVRSNTQFNGSSRTPNGYAGTKTLNVHLTDQYGNSAGGKIQTRTGMASQAVNNAVSGIIIGQVTGGAVQRAKAGGVAEAIADGRYGEAGRISSAAVADSVYGGAFGGIYDIIKDVQDAKARKTSEQAQKAREAAELANQQKTPAKETVYMKVIHDVQEALPNGRYGPRQTSEIVFEVPKGTVITRENPASIRGENSQSLTFNYPGGGSETVYRYQPNKNEASYIGYNGASRQEYLASLQRQQNPRPEDFMLTEGEIVAEIQKQLADNASALNNNTAALTALLNAMWQSGGLNPGNTVTGVTGGDAANTFTTAPYTPAGSQQAQQTQFIVNNNGNVITNVIPRPDLAPNSSQAPTREQIGGQNEAKPSPDKPGTSQPSPSAPSTGQSDGKPDVCKANPNNIACAELGSADYQDISLPTQNINLRFDPANIFSTDGTCPKPHTFMIEGHSFTLSYETVCQFARLARPIVILVGMVMAMYMAYSAVKEL